MLRKDHILDRLAVEHNVAQFVSFEPGSAEPKQAFARILGDKPNETYPSLENALERLLEKSSEGRVNIRTFDPADPKSNPFYYGLESLSEVSTLVHKHIDEGLYVIVNETIDVSDGGVSGVVEGGIAEFAPDDTPRCVEKPGTVSLPLDWAIRLLEIVYKFTPEIEVDEETRLEFSVHPEPRGWREGHTLVWEAEKVGKKEISPALQWPNRLSRVMGDKAYGLLIAHLAGMPVPSTTVFGRRLKPFSFGTETSTHDVWVRTCPTEPVPGKYTTIHGWADPYSIMDSDDPEGTKISSAVVQSGVQAAYSGALIGRDLSEFIVEGVSGRGDLFMLGERKPEKLPDDLLQILQENYNRLTSIFGPVRFEWVFDGKRLWIVQLHSGGVSSKGHIIVPGDPGKWVPFDITLGLEPLRELVNKIESDEGIVLSGRVGLTSHFADVLRRAGRPAKISEAVFERSHS